jgi:outer membrane receptor protein involved in Fe transport
LDHETTVSTRNPPFLGKVGLRYEKEFNLVGPANFYADANMNWAATTHDEASGRGGNGMYESWKSYNLTLGLQGGEDHSYNVTLSVNNLFNKTYYPARSANRSGNSRGGSTNMPAAGRHVVLGVSYEF